jgi:hypothetical protein
MGLTSSKGDYSYHINQRYGTDTFISIWPQCGFGEYCTSEKEALKEYDRLTKTEPDSVFQVGKYPAVKDNDNNIIGVTGEFKIIKN